MSVSSTAPRRMSVGVVGAGRVGVALGAALSRVGYQVVAASTRSAAGRARIQRLLPEAEITPVARVPRRADLVIVAVPDDAVGAVVGELADVGAIRAGQVVAHVSGAHGLGVLAAATGLGAEALAVHPAMTFTGGPGDLERLLAGVSFGVTAAAPLRPFATRLVADLGGSPEWIADVDRPLYHAALAHGANHLVTLVNEAVDLLRATGVADPGRTLAPLLHAALANALARGDEALTGPVSRGDAGTIDRHISALRANVPDSIPAYLALARRSADRAIGSGRLRAVDAERLLDVLAASVAPATTAPAVVR